MFALTSDKKLAKVISVANNPDSSLNLPQGKIYKFQRRELIQPYSSSSLWYINKGVVRASTLDEDGTLISLGFWSAGDIVGSRLSDIDPYQIDCLTEVEATILYPFTACPTSALLAHVKRMEDFLQIMQQKEVKKRLILFFKWLFCRFGQDSKDGKQLNLHLTHDEIAEAIATSRVTVTRLMKQLHQEDFLRWSRKSHLLLNNF
jgi:CRP-like cAMP-binding protein